MQIEYKIVLKPKALCLTPCKYFTAHVASGNCKTACKYFVEKQIDHFTIVMPNDRTFFLKPPQFRLLEKLLKHKNVVEIYEHGSVECGAV